MMIKQVVYSCLVHGHWDHIFFDLITNEYRKYFVPEREFYTQPKGIWQRLQITTLFHNNVRLSFILRRMFDMLEVYEHENGVKAKRSSWLIMTKLYPRILVLAIMDIGKKSQKDAEKYLTRKGKKDWTWLETDL